MTKYNTGNPLGSSDPRDLYDNAENLDAAVNSDGATFTDRLGKSRLTVQGMVDAATTGNPAVGAAQDALASADRAEAQADRAELEVAEGINAGVSQVTSFATAEADRAETARDAAFVNADVYPDEATGRAAVADGEQFQVVNGAEIIRYRRDSSTTHTEVARYPAGGRDSLTVNAGQEMPLREKSRDGVTATMPQSIKNSLLDIRVLGARPGKYYRLEWVGNGVEVAGKARYELLFNEYEAANYETDSATGMVVAVGLNDIPAESLDFTGGIITRRFASPHIEGLEFVVTYRPAELPSSVALNTAGPANAYGFIIDESAYSYRDSHVYESINDLAARDSLMVNRGNDMPLREKVRDGNNPALPEAVKNSILDLRVIGAREGKYYRLEWINNGSDVLGASKAYGVIFHEYDKDTFSTDSAASSLQVFGLNDADFSIIDTSSPIITRTFDSPVIAGLSFVLTYKPDELPADSFIPMNSLTNPGRGYIIDESRYTLAEAIPSVQVDKPLTYDLTSAGQLRAHWKSHGKLYRVNIGPIGHNGLPNIWRVERSDNVETPSWSVINSSATDWLPPLTVKASTNGDSGSKIFTGGNHGSSGGESGDQTARNILYNVIADGSKVSDLGDSGFANELRVQIVNELMAYNTITFPRYVLRQTFDLVITPGAISVECEVKAYEDLEVLTDYGPQMVTSGFTNGTVLFLGGQFENRFSYAAEDSGPVSLYPDAFATVLQDATNGQQVSWFDRSYGKGDSSWVSPSDPLAFTTASKAYHSIVRQNSLTAPNLLAGEAYRWRGGYAWQAPGVQGADLDSLFQRSVRGVESTVYVYSGSDFTSF